MVEKHSALLLNIGTFPEEDAAYELLNNLRMSLPLVVVVTWVLDALLAAAYLKWFHPWKIILQEVICFSLGIQTGTLFNRSRTNGSLRMTLMVQWRTRLRR